jgi:hypothetical protein
MQSFRVSAISSFRDNERFQIGHLNFSSFRFPACEGATLLPIAICRKQAYRK